MCNTVCVVVGRARAALAWLTAPGSKSAYSDFLQKHQEFLARFRSRAPRYDETLLPIIAMETVGIECAIWPAWIGR